jgi:transcriptional regulator with XRE-family HTH domain
MTLLDDPAEDIDRHLIAFGRAFLRARRARGLSQRRLEALSSVPQSTISRLENGKMPSVRASHLARLVAVLGSVTIDARDGPNR